jgi:hypothetical protein
MPTLAVFQLYRGIFREFFFLDNKITENENDDILSIKSNILVSHTTFI